MSYLHFEAAGAVLVILALGFLSSPAAACEPHKEEAENKDRSRVTALWRDCSGEKIVFRVLFKPAGGKEEREALTLELERKNGAALGAGLTDIDGDGFFDAQISGECGAGPNCGMDIYRYDPLEGKFYHFYSGGAADVVVEDGFLIESGRSSCCSWEYHIYKIPADKTRVEHDGMDFGIEVSADVVQGEEEEEVKSSACRFFRLKKGGAETITIAPPAERWLKYCEEYTENYTVQQPSSPAASSPPEPAPFEPFVKKTF